MARQTYGTKPYYNYHDVPAQQGGYAYEPEQHVKWYVVETTTVERVRGPPSRYSEFGGAPLKSDPLKENTHKYALPERHEDYETLYGSAHENSSPARYQERGNLMANFLNKLQIGARPPAKTSNNLSDPNKYRPTSPEKYRSKSPNKYQPTSPNKYHTTDPINYRPKSPNIYESTSPKKYRPTSPIKYHPTSPIKYQPKSPNKYESTSPNKYRPKSPKKYESTSPNKYRPTSPNKYHPTRPKKYESTSPNKYRPTSPNKYSPKSPKKYESTSPNKYRPTSPNKYHPTSMKKYESTSPNKYRPTSPNKYRPTSPKKYESTSPNKYHPASPNKYCPSSPNKYHPTSPINYQHISSTYTYPPKEANMMKPQTLPGPIKYRPTSPTHNYPSKDDHINRPQYMLDQNKYRSTSPVYRFPSNDGQQVVRNQSLIIPNKNQSSSMGVGDRNNRVMDFSNPNYQWQRAGPPTTRRPLTGPTNSIDEALGFLIESVNYPRAQPIEHEGQYARPTFGNVTNRPYMRSNTIDSHEAVRRYNGAFVP